MRRKRRKEQSVAKAWLGLLAICTENLLPSSVVPGSGHVSPQRLTSKREHFYFGEDRVVFWFTAIHPAPRTISVYIQYLFVEQGVLNIK